MAVSNQMFRTLTPCATLFQRLVLLFLFLVASFCHADGSPHDFDSVQEAFNSGKYEAALQQLLSHPAEDSTYYYNLGTTLLELNHVGVASAYLEKANRLNPHDVAIQQNLQLAHNALSRALGPEKLDPASSWGETLADNLRLDEIRGALGLVGFIIALFWIRSYWKTRRLRETLLQPAGWLGIGALAITACLYGLERVSAMSPVAVCLEKTTIRSGPGNTFVEVSQAEAGSKLRALGPVATAAPSTAAPASVSSPVPAASSPSGSSEPSRGDSAPPLWRQVRYSTDGIGWVPASSVLLL
jgi:tetratricopeptide (TPR) repeat protein